MTKKTDMRDQELLEADNPGDNAGGLWNSIASTFSSSTDNSAKDETLNIFCLASGHLYERLLK